MKINYHSIHVLLVCTRAYQQSVVQSLEFLIYIRSYSTSTYYYGNRLVRSLHTMHPK